MVWPLLIGLACICLYSEIVRILKAVASRIEQGDSIEAGASGIKLTASAPKLADPLIQEDASKDSRDYDESIPHQIYLLHSARRDKRLDKSGEDYYRLRIWIDADEPELLRNVKSVTYHLHPTFASPSRTVDASEDGFALVTAAWGQFMVYASVEMKDGAKPLKIERYLDF